MNDTDDFDSLTLDGMIWPACESAYPWGLPMLVFLFGSFICFAFYTEKGWLWLV